MDTTNVKIAESILPYLEEIAERLWAERAAVMVGAGFSKNAGSTFPDWSQLGDLFYLKAYGKKPDSNAQKYQNVLRLAEEVEAAIGRPALDNLLRSNIPDQDFKPSELHTELLKLQWADVFTTNYDTLLERASEQVVNRRYETVLNKEDLAYANSPRIVKLHGSFPSERPFIITEEDYRIYPMNNAPFVNTVQQALLENTFCLIGFSGDDPNFLQWIGWIRDNLGKEKAQKIYLIGVFNLSSSKLQLLAQRGVIVVDFSLCDGIKANDHQLALKKFIHHVRENKPNALEWPYKPKFQSPDKEVEKDQQISSILLEWRRQRSSYPGWLIVPHRNRDRLWFYTESWMDFIPEANNPTTSSDIFYAQELIWRLEKCLIPLYSNQIDSCELLIKKYWPFNLQKPSTTINTIDISTNPDLNWNEIKTAWNEISLALLRVYREDGEEQKWKDLKDLIYTNEIHEQLSQYQKELLTYQVYLFNLFILDYQSAIAELERWEPAKSQIYWRTIKHAAYAEVGIQENTKELIKESLYENRKLSRSTKPTSKYTSASIESYQMFILSFFSNSFYINTEKPANNKEKQKIKEKLIHEHQINSENFSSQDETEVKSNNNTSKSKFNSPEEDFEDLQANMHRDRKTEWESILRKVREEDNAEKIEHEEREEDKRREELKSLRCDPQEEFERLKINATIPLNPKERVIRKFDIGKTQKFYNLNSECELDTYRFMIFTEDIGLPLRVKNTLFVPDSMTASLNNISKYSTLPVFFNIVDEMDAPHMIQRQMR